MVLARVSVLYACHESLRKLVTGSDDVGSQTRCASGGGANTDDRGLVFLNAYEENCAALGRNR